MYVNYCITYNRRKNIIVNSFAAECFGKKDQDDTVKNHVREFHSTFYQTTEANSAFTFSHLLSSCAAIPTQGKFSLVGCAVSSL